ncbi:hypothetical protein Vafri_21381, partial [Volvox africanus]
SEHREEPQPPSPQPSGAGYSAAPRAVADLYEQQQAGPEGQKSSAADRAVESVQAGAEEVAGRAAGAGRVVRSTAEQTATSVGEAAERGVERAERTTEGARESAGKVFTCLSSSLSPSQQRLQRYFV